MCGFFLSSWLAMLTPNSWPWSAWLDLHKLPVAFSESNIFKKYIYICIHIYSCRWCKKISEHIMQVSVHDLSTHICYTYTISSLSPVYISKGNLITLRKSNCHFWPPLIHHFDRGGNLRCKDNLKKQCMNMIEHVCLNMDFWSLECEIHFVPAELSTPSSATDLVHQSGSRRFFPVFALNIP